MDDGKNEIEVAHFVSKLRVIKQEGFGKGHVSLQPSYPFCRMMQEINKGICK